MNIRSLSRREQAVLIDLLQHHAWHTSRVATFIGVDGKPRKQLRFVVRSSSFVEISPYILQSLQSRELLGVEFHSSDDSGIPWSNVVTHYCLTDTGIALARVLALESFVATPKEGGS